MFGFNKELCPPTGIEACVFANFTGRNDDNLIMAKNTVLEIYKLEENTDYQPLRLITKYSLFGQIQSIEAITFTKSRDYLILTFKDAKVSILEWNPAIYDVSLVSMHYYENIQSHIESGITRYHCIPIVRVDPENRCATVLCYDKYLAVIPFLQSNDDFLSSGKSKSKILSSYVIELEKIDPNAPIRHVKDVIFLEGYYQPTVLILHEPKQTWAGRAASNGNTCVITAISLDLKQQKHPIIWTVEELPYNCFTLLAVPRPVGGALVISPNSIISCNQNIKYVLALNLFVPQNESTSYKIDTSNTYVALDAARFTFLSKNKFIASLKGGELYIFHIFSEANTIQSITLSRGNASVIASCICKVKDKYFFLGSRLGDSVLIEYNESTVIGESENIPFKIKKTEDGTAKPIDEIESEFDLDKDIEEFYSRKNTKVKKKDYSFKKVDSIINIGPISDFCFASCSDRKREDFSDTEKAMPSDPEEIVACTGHGKNGAITILQRGVRPLVSTSFPIPKCQNIWTLFEYDNKDDIITGKRSREQFTNNNNNIKKDHTLIIVSTENSTMILKAKDELTEISDQDDLEFFVDKPTFNAGNFNNGKYLIQIGENTIRLLSSSFNLIDSQSFSECIVDSIICDPYVLLFFGPLDPFLFLYLNDDHSKFIQQELRLSSTFDKNMLIPIKDDIISYCLYKDTTTIPLCIIKPEIKIEMEEDDNNDIYSDEELEDEIKNENIKQENVSIKEEKQEEEEEKENIKSPEKPKKSTSDSESSDDDDEEFALFYGGADNSPKKEKESINKQNDSNDIIFDENSSDSEDIDNFYGTTSSPTKKENINEESIKPITAKPKFYCAVTRQSGSLEIFSIEKQADNTLKGEIYFKALKFSKGIQLLVNDLTNDDNNNNNNIDEKLDIKSSSKIIKTNSSPRIITEISICLLGTNPLPFLFAFTDYGDLYIYGSFHYNNQLRFYRFKHEIILRPYHILTTQNENTEKPREPRAKKRIYEFKHGSKNGIFIGGLHPHWIFCERSFLRIFPMTGEFFIDSYADFNNTLFCPNGFIYSVKDNINISRISPLMNYEHVWAIRKIHLKQDNKHYTPHLICYHSATKSCIVTVSYSELNTDNEMNRPVQSGGLPRFIDKYEIFLINLTPGNDIILNTYPLEEYEHTISLSKVKLLVKGQSNEKAEKKNLIAIGTAIVLGEDDTCRGRIFIFDIITQRTDDNKISLKIKHLFDKTEKGPVSAVNSILGHMVMAVGPKIFIHTFENGKELIGKAFFDTQNYIITIKTLKNYIIIGDMYNSVYFLIWKRLLRELSLLGKDYGHLQITEAEFVVNNDTLGIVAADKSQNLQIMSFDPNNINSRAQGKMLIPACEYHIAETIIKANRIKLFQENQSCIGSVYVTTSGSIGVIGTLDEEKYNCLLTLQSRMLYGIPHTAGLNPKTFRKYKPLKKQLRPRNNVLLDTTLLLKYNSLDSGFQKEFANLTKSSTEDILKYLDLLNSSITIC